MGTTGQPERIRYQTDLQVGEPTGWANPNTAKPPKPPKKPSWQRFMDLNWDVLEWLAGNPIVQWVVGSSIWTWLFSRRCQPVAVMHHDPKPQFSARLEVVKPPVKPPWRRFMDLNWKMGEAALKEAARQVIEKWIEWGIFSRKRQPAAAAEV